jgi:hypothetical protein
MHEPTVLAIIVICSDYTTENRKLISLKNNRYIITLKGRE